MNTRDANKPHTLHVDVVYTSTTLFRLDVLLQPAPVGIVRLELLSFLDGIRDKWLSNNIVASLGLRDVNAVDNRVDLATLEFGLDAVRKEGITCCDLYLANALVRVARHLNHSDIL